jgi:hypothetical protein
MADPAVNYVGVGSFLAEGVMNAFAHVAVGGEVGSYDAVNPLSGVAHELITPAVNSSAASTGQMNCSFTRPDGSFEGFNALDIANGGGAPPLAVPPGPGCIQVARSDTPPGSGRGSGAGALNVAGAFVYVPFAVDGTTTATGPTQAGQTTTTQCVSTTPGCLNVNPSTGVGQISFTVPVTNITNADLFTIANLQALFAQGMPVTVGGVQYWPMNGAVTQPPGSVVVDLYFPSPSAKDSGTLSLWASLLGFNAVSPPPWVHQTILAGPAAGIPVADSDGSAYASDPGGIGPYDIAQWIAQSNGVSGFGDLRHTAILHALNGVAPITGTSLNTNFPIEREMYNVMRFDAIVNTGDGKFDPILAALFAGPTSLMCASAFTIRQYGFGTLPAATTPDTCGSTANSLRVQL